MDARMLYLHALSPIHSGTGQATGIIDLPVAREKVSGWPYLPGSSIKGVLRDACSDTVDRALFTAAFGPADTQQASEGAGSLWFADAHLLCLPVRSYYGSFAWVSCPLALRRWERDHRSGGLTFGPAAIPIPEPGAALVAERSALAVDDQVFLEDLDLAARPDQGALAISDTIAASALEAEWGVHFRERFAILEDDTFNFLAESATEVVARIRLDDEKKTVQRGALWYEEAVPAETIFAAPLLVAPRNGRTAADLFGMLSPALGGLLQIGGNASVGRGLVQARLAEVAP